MKKFLIYLSISAFVFSSCTKKDIELKPGLENFDISLENTSFKVGEEVSFNLHGDPDMIVFYSGEVEHEYAYREGRTLTLDDAVVSFTTSKPVTWKRQDDQFHVVASTDFNGDYSDFSNIESATWTDITDRFVLSSSITFSPSGEVDVSDLFVEGKPLYIAFKYVTHPQEMGRAGMWHVQSFSFVGQTLLGPLVLGDMETSGWRLLDQHPEESPSQSKMTKTRVTLWGNLDVDLQTESWAVSKPFDTGEIDLGLDLPVAIKGMESAPLDRYTYIYEKPGTYTVTFIATNASVDDSKKVRREIEVTVTE